MLKFMTSPFHEDLSDDFFQAYDHHTQRCAQVLPKLASQAHSKCPIFHSKNYGGYYVVTRYDDIMEVARNPTVFSSRRGFEIPERGSPKMIPLHYDPPESSNYKRLLNSYFSSTAIERFREEVRELVTQRIEEKLKEGQFDAVDDLARPIAGSMVLKILGLDPELWDEYTTPYHNYAYRIVPPDQVYRQIYRLSLRVLEDIRRAREAPVPGTVLGDLVGANIQGRPLTDEELTAMVIAVIVGGSETVQATIGMALVYLDENHAQRQRLIDDPSLIPSASDELLRLLAANPCVARTVMSDYKLGNVQLREGDKVLLLWAAGNLDPDKFPEPFEFDLNRNSNPHLTFGAGNHKCLGLHLARMELAVCLEVVLQMLPDYRVKQNRLKVSQDCSLILGFESVPIEFDVQK